MSRPDPATDLIGYLRWLGDQLEALQAERMSEKLSAQQAATLMGYHPRFFHGRPWRIPGFGMSGTLHSLAEWKAWTDRPEVERRSEWEKMPLKEKNKARGAA
jgi:hypothetical protein